MPSVFRCRHSKQLAQKKLQLDQRPSVLLELAGPDDGPAHRPQAKDDVGNAPAPRGADGGGLAKATLTLEAAGLADTADLKFAHLPADFQALFSRSGARFPAELDWAAKAKKATTTAQREKKATEAKNANDSAEDEARGRGAAQHVKVGFTCLLP